MAKRELPAVVVDTREPHEHVRADGSDKCEVCGARSNRPCEPVFVPCVFAPGTPRDTPHADRPRLALPTVRAHLDAGDYSLPGLESRVAIERKSGADMLATIFGEDMDSVGNRAANLDRFRAELERAYVGRYALFAIVCEESPGWMFTEARRRFERYGKAFDPFALFAILRSFAVDLACPTIWAGSKGLAELEVGATLARVWSQASGGADAKKAVKRGYAMPWLGALDGVVTEADGAGMVPDDGEKGAAA